MPSLIALIVIVSLIAVTFFLNAKYVIGPTPTIGKVVNAALVILLILLGLILMGLLHPIVSSRIGL
jgi:hypothetical protein